jgi:hypothetical protein
MWGAILSRAPTLSSERWLESDNSPDSAFFVLSSESYHRGCGIDDACMMAPSRWNEIMAFTAYSSKTQIERKPISDRRIINKYSPICIFFEKTIVAFRKKILN